MSELSIVVEPDPPKAWVEVVERGLRNHNIAATGIVSSIRWGLSSKTRAALSWAGSWGISPADGCT